MKSLSVRAAASLVLGLLLSSTMFQGSGSAQSDSRLAARAGEPVNSAAVSADAWFEDYKFRNGESLTRLKVHYSTLGTPHLNAKGEIDNAVLVLHWTGADSRVLLSPTFYDALFADGRPLDARRYFLVFPDSVGHGQSSKPSDGLKTKFPKYDYGDIVDLQHKVVTETLGIKHLHAILGISMGGMNAWQWAEAYPDMMDGVMPVVSLPIAVSGRNLLWRRMVIDAIRSDPEWNDGNYTATPRGWIMGYNVLRLMIDSASALQHEVPTGKAVDKFLKTNQVAAEHVDANDMLYSLGSSFSYDPEPELAKIKTKLFAVNFSDDEFNPSELHVLEKSVPTLAQGRFLIQEGTMSSPGHLTMTWPSLWAQHVAEFMGWLGDKPTTD
ncbi:alpha/beta fold hydrolase [Bradyrhizobium elkanii]|uniref:alpha/beta fold hydrolase n=1 Tax=Bradyrhizobium elkanii TaxID=29448 RepID=UPI00209F9242|nr:alpha/beta fold hydrolase [Bradyrhizobium elkanii]MCP1968497.1 homoserine O-acetyltransferase [Bradyrhizobium elkanii]MCS4110002.1 homoserine O-acetyltransferase [Bradyrhizobium elkanii]